MPTEHCVRTYICLCPCKCSHLEPLVCIHIFTSIHVLYHKYSQVYEPKLCNSHLCAQCASAFGASAVAAPSAAAAAHGAPWTHRICHFEHVIQLGGCWFWAGTTIKLISRIWPKTMVGGFMLFVYFIRLNDYLQMGTNHFQTRQYVYLVDRSSIHVWNKIVFPSDIVCANPHWSYLSWLQTCFWHVPDGLSVNIQQESSYICTTVVHPGSCVVYIYVYVYV